MKHSLIGIAILTMVTAGPAFAAQKPKGGAPKPHAVSKTVVKSQPTAHGKSTVKLQSKSTVKPVKVKATVSKTTVKSSPKSTTKSTTASARTSVKTTKKTEVARTSTPTTTTTTTTTTTNTTQLSPVQQKLERNTNLAAKLRSRLPAGTDLMTAAAGFKNLGQFVSTVNASYNHNLSFEGLKQRIVYENMSLGQAMKDMR
ncbi:MAG TPA: hypothetical protein VFK57_06995 [Vicinamibacterales bacterium]|nr:hypothetical protein [Vicinamibacterales bacterium]